jgi:hypothetical protein
MSDDSQRPNFHEETLRAAEREVAARLKKEPHLLNPPVADAVAKEFTRRRVIPFPNGVLRVLLPGNNSQFYALDDTNDPLAPFISELAAGTADEDKIEATRQREKNVAEIEEEKARSGAYRL